ncbi:MAG: porin family protein [Chitinophagaceae bacterium]
MKKFHAFIFTMCFLVMNNSADAQVSISLGVKAGLSIPNLKSKGDNPLDKGWESRSGLYGGLVADVHFSENFAITTELNYSSQGGKRTGAQAIPNPNPPPQYLYADFKNIAIINYAEVPVMATYKFSSASKTHLIVQGGVYGGFLLRAKNVSSGESLIYLDEQLTIPVPLSPTQNFDHTTDIKEDIKSFNYGIQGAAGFTFDLASGSIRILAGGNYGLTSIQKDTANGNDHTGAVTVTVGYLFNL